MLNENILNNTRLVLDLEKLLIYEEIKPKIGKKIRYFILDKENKDHVGTIYADYNDYITVFGNLGYEIKKEYQGKNLTLNLLEMLTPIFYNRGLKKIVISVSKDNVASNKIALNYGGKLMDPNYKTIGLNIYEVNLEEKIGEKKIK